MKIYLKKVPSAESPRVCHSKRSEACWFAEHKDKRLINFDCPCTKEGELKCYNSETGKNYIWIKQQEVNK